MKISPKTIFLQTKIRDNEAWNQRAEAILRRFPEAKVCEVESHHRIPELYNADPSDWLRSKRDHLVLGIKAGLQHKLNGRSADYIAASISNGCLSSCQYCYVARQKGGSNTLTLFLNVDEIADSIARHAENLGPKVEANQCDPRYWTYDIGCNADLSLDAMVCDHPGYMVERFRTMPYAKATFATKTVNEEFWLRYEPQGKTRIRYSIMPTRVARLVDVGTSPIPQRIRSVNQLVEAGYEVHLNFSPIILYDGAQWTEDWKKTWQEIDDVLSPAAKEQLACEAFFLTHSPALHEQNLAWNPRGEELLWQPAMQSAKATRAELLVYRADLRQKAMHWFLGNLERRLPYCKVRYSF